MLEHMVIVAQNSILYGGLACLMATAVHAGTPEADVERSFSTAFPLVTLGTVKGPTRSLRLAPNFDVEESVRPRGMRPVAASLAAAASSDELSARDGSRFQALAKNFRREGLPLARLWQGNHGLVSLGLNPKGKPGLWFYRQTH